MASSLLLWIAVVIILIWLFGWILIPAIGFLIHILLILAVIIIVVWLITGRRPVG
jgi:membrane protein DedA with SNARE-associated domain